MLDIKDVFKTSDHNTIFNVFICYLLNLKNSTVHSVVLLNFVQALRACLNRKVQRGQMKLKVFKMKEGSWCSRSGWSFLPQSDNEISKICFIKTEHNCLLMTFS